MRILLGFLFLLLSTISVGQNYQPINSNTAIFLGLDSSMAEFGFRTDSVAIENNDTSYFSYPTFRIEGGIEFGCVNLNALCPFGRKVHYSDLGWTYFLGNNNDTISVSHSASLNDSWVLFRQSPDVIIKGTVTAISIQEWLGITESVKVISMQAQNNQGQNISHPCNGNEILIGETMGLLQFPDFYFWPNEIQILKVVGDENLKRGLRRFSNFEIYDFDTCDEFHFERHNETSEIPPDDNFFVKRVLAKNETATTYNYTIEIQKIRHYMQPVSGFPPYVSVVELTHDTISEYYSKSSDVSYLLYPDELVLELDTNNLSISWSKPSRYKYQDGRPEFTVSNNYNTYYADINSLSNLDSCISEFTDLCCHNPININNPSFSLGLGETQTYSVGGGGGSPIVPVRERLVYFNKCGTEWGTPLSESLLNQIEETAEITFNLYPNPATEAVQIQLKQQEDVEVLVTDVLGREVYRKIPRSAQNYKMELDVSGWPNGVYLVSVINQKGIRSTQRLVVQH